MPITPARNVIDLRRIATGLALAALLLLVLWIRGLPLLVMILLLHLVGPAVLTLAISEFMRSRGWIRPGDMALARG